MFSNLKKLLYVGWSFNAIRPLFFTCTGTFCSSLFTANYRSIGGWKNALGAIADNPTESNPSFVQYIDEAVVVINDAYPKARTHLLIIVKDSSINTVNDLTKDHLPLLEKICSVAEEQISKRQQASSTYPYLVGFHAVPSMNRLHCHVLSSDLDNENMKHKKHWNSFTTPFFVPLTTVISILKANKTMNINESKANECLKFNLRCHYCCTEMRNMPILKDHIMRCDSNRWVKSVYNAFLSH